MTEWWTYHLSDLLLFSAHTYRRLFEIYNAAIWPAQFVAAGAGLTILALLRRATATASRGISAILAACWLWTGVAFLARRYATINWSAMGFAWGFGVEAALLWIGVLRGRLLFELPTDAGGRAGLGIFVFALVVEPLIGPLLGRGWKGLELFGLAPDPTAVATLGLCLLVRARRRWPLILIPALWSVYTGIFLLAMKAPDFWIPALAAALSMALLIRQARLRRLAPARPPTV